MKYRNLFLILLITCFIINCSNGDSGNTNLEEDDSEISYQIFENTADDDDLYNLTKFTRIEGEKGLVGSWKWSWRGTTYPYETNSESYEFKSDGSYTYSFSWTAIGTNGGHNTQYGKYKVSKSENNRRFYLIMTRLSKPNEPKTVRYRVSDKYLYTFADDDSDDYRISEYFNIKYESDFGDMPTDTKIKPNTILSENELPHLKDDTIYFAGWYIDDIKVLENEYKIVSDITLTGKWCDVSEFKKQLDNIQIGDIMLSNGMVIAPENYKDIMCPLGVVISPIYNNANILFDVCLYKFASETALETNAIEHFENSYQNEIKKYTTKTIIPRRATYEELQIIRQNLEEINAGFSVLGGEDSILYNESIYYNGGYNFVTNSGLDKSKYTSSQWQELEESFRYLYVKSFLRSKY